MVLEQGGTATYVGDSAVVVDEPGRLGLVLRFGNVGRTPIRARALGVVGPGLVASTGDTVPDASGISGQPALGRPVDSLRMPSQSSVQVRLGVASDCGAPVPLDAPVAVTVREDTGATTTVEVPTDVSALLRATAWALCNAQRPPLRAAVTDPVGSVDPTNPVTVRLGLPLALAALSMQGLEVATTPTETFAGDVAIDVPVGRTVKFDVVRSADDCRTLLGLDRRVASDPVYVRPRAAPPGSPWVEVVPTIDDATRPAVDAALRSVCTYATGLVVDATVVSSTSNGRRVSFSLSLQEGMGAGAVLAFYDQDPDGGWRLAGRATVTSADRRAGIVRLTAIARDDAQVPNQLTVVIQSGGPRSPNPVQLNRR